MTQKFYRTLSDQDLITFFHIEFNNLSSENFDTVESVFFDRFKGSLDKMIDDIPIYPCTDITCSLNFSDKGNTY